MKKKVTLFSIIVIIAISIIVITIVNLKNKKDMNYQLEEVNEINYMVFSENNKFGVINKTGEVVVQALYDEVQIPNPSKPLFVCMYNYDTEKNQYNIKVLNEKSEQILYQFVVVEAIKINPVNNEIPYEKSVLKYKKDNKYGLIDFQGNIIEKAKYEEITGLDYKEGLLLVKKNGKYGVININGATIIKAKYDFIESDGYYEEGNEYQKSGFIVGKKSNNDYKYGYINYKGKEILKTKYNQIERIINVNKNDDIYLVAFENGKAGLYINKKRTIKHKYEDIVYDENNNCLVLQEDSKQGISDFYGNIIIDIQYDNIFISGKYVNAQKDGHVDIYNYDTKKKINFENVVGLNQTTNDNYSIAITADDTYKILDNQKNEIKENEYEYLNYIDGDYFIACNNQKYGVVDINGQQIVEFKYDFIEKIGNTKLLQALVLQENKTDLVLENKVISSMINCDIYLEDNYLIQRSSSDLKYIGIDGTILKNTQILNNELYASKQGEKWGFVNKNEETIVKADYDFVTEFDEYGYAGIKKDGKWGVINLNGDVIIEPTYTIDWNSPKFIGKYYEYDTGYNEPYYICNDIL